MRPLPGLTEIKPGSATMPTPGIEAKILYFRTGSDSCTIAPINTS